jgi:hypothetical protein
LNKFLDVVALVSCGYGVSISNTIWFAISCIILFRIIYSFFFRIADSKDEDYIQQLKEALGFSAIVLLSIPTELYPQKNKKYKIYASQIKYHLPIVERLIGWGLLVLFINTLSRLMMR